MELFYKVAYHRMYDHYLPKLRQTIEHLNAEELWKQEGAVNSIGGIVLHICEHVKRNSSRYSNPNIHFEKGIEEYFPIMNLSTDMLSQTIQKVFDEWKREYINACNEKPSIDIHSLFHLVEHTSYHLGQVVDRTKLLKGTKLDFCQNGLNEKNLKACIERTTVL
ncbi:DinB family protein [Bacillus gaemokensis]|uniref:Group-specific protein n=1 Tax=Bacillus gaemokensis TaxID=574375 RepID=A0A073KKV1_9BACI|nr:hypothetical protein [Bacillus gaemokensis]KEK22923.1 hypothetical protein BAGA_15490 [Bacillus gaemokensis]KYG34724.1 hypothetical protein AZF08_10095 [Bacillus gaemokensis]